MVRPTSRAEADRTSASATLAAVQITEVASPPDGRDLRGLAEVTVACVAEGASIGWLHGLDVETACEWWRDLLADPGLRCLVARMDDGQVVGTVSLRLDQPETGRHRADVTKLLVDPAARRQGIAAALMAEAERVAATEGRTVLLLDTESGSVAETFYRAQGWTEFGRLEHHAARPDGVLAGSTFFVKTIPAR